MSKFETTLEDMPRLSDNTEKIVEGLNQGTWKHRIEMLATLHSIMANIIEEMHDELTNHEDNPNDHPSGE